MTTKIGRVAAVGLLFGCRSDLDGITTIDGVLDGPGSESLSDVQVLAVDREGVVIDSVRTDSDGAFELEVHTNAYTAVVVQSSLPTGFVVYGLAVSYLETTFWVRTEADIHHEFGNRLTHCPPERPSIHVFDGMIQTPVTFPAEWEDRTERVDAWFVEVVDQPDAVICTQLASGSTGGESLVEGPVESSSAGGLEPGFVEYVLESEAGVRQDFLAYVPDGGIAAIEWAWFMESR